MPFADTRISVATRTVQWLLVAVTVAIALVSVADAQAAADTTPPEPPLGVSVLQGNDWQSTNSFDVEWDNPIDESSIEVAHYELCPAVPMGPCTTHQEASTGISSVAPVMPYAGWFWFRVWLEDAAGNVDPDDKSMAVMLRFDDQLPPKATVRHSGAWINAAAPTSPTLTLELEQSSAWPLSGIRGYSVTTDGSSPDNVIEAVAAQDYDRFAADYLLADIAEGTTQLRVKSVSNSLLASGETESVSLQVDRTAPHVDAEGLPPSEGWHRKAVRIELKGVDQPALSGMAPAPSGQPVQDGAHLAYALDGGATALIRGDEASLAVVNDGHHALTFQGFDRAGNPSDKQTVSFKIDQTAPTGAFRGVDAGDPQRLAVDVADATSGVESGRIEYRREGVEGFTPLATRVEGDRLSARVDDSALAPGRYEFRAVVRDVAGNEAVIGRRADGSAMELGLPVRQVARLQVGAERSGKACAKAKRRLPGRPKRGRKPRAKCRTAPLTAGDTSLRLDPGRRVTLAGRLTKAGDAPIADVDVAVEGQLRSGSALARVGTARTDGQGRLRFVLPAGASRTVSFRYLGSNTVQPVGAQVVTRVRAPVRLSVNRRRLVNGQSVRFRGRLSGKPIPAGGKLVALQARVGRQWRTFATPRANGRGVFAHRYRFTATTGVRRYVFRALVTREAAYPYETGSSPKVRVTVRGR